MGFVQRTKSNIDSSLIQVKSRRFAGTADGG